MDIEKPGAKKNSEQPIENKRKSLLEEVKNANERARMKNPNYKGPLSGFSGKGSSDVLSEMSEENRARWKKTNLPNELLTSEQDDLKLYAEKCGIDLTSF